MWPFKRKVQEPFEPKEEPKTVPISSDDTGMYRAELAMRHAGFALNSTMYNQLPWIAQVFDAYKKLDHEAGIHDAKSKE